MTVLWRALAILLLLANLGYWLWSRGDLAGFGLAPSGLSEHEPQRLGQQVRPQLLELRRLPPPPGSR